MNSKGLLIVYTGASGVGKGTIMKKLLEADCNNRLSVSATTRKPRTGEVNGREYYFISFEEFKQKIDNHCFLEYARYCDNYYGTPKQAVEDMINQGLNVFLEIEVQGGTQIKKNYPDCVSIFIMPPSMEELEKRLRGRGTEREEAITQRLNVALTEIAFADSYDHVVTNIQVDDAVEEIMRIIQQEKQKKRKTDT